MVAKPLNKILGTIKLEYFGPIRNSTYGTVG
jgi:hypothetical protein